MELAQELEIAQAYERIEKLRLDDRLDVRWEGFFSGLRELHNEISIVLGVSVHLG